MDTLMIIGLLLVAAFACIGAGWFVSGIIDGCFNKRRLQRIEFEKFRDLYAASPKRWELGGNFVTFITLTDNRWRKEINFGFNFSDCCRYHKWKRALEKQKKQEREREELQEVISTIKSDLDGNQKPGIVIAGDKEKAYQVIKAIQKQFNVKPSDITFHSPGPQTREKDKER